MADATTAPANGPASGKKKKKIKVTKVVNGIDTEVEIEVDDNGPAGAGPAWGANDSHRLLNKHLTRVDGPVKASGTAMYTHDVRLEGMLYGRILRCPHAHAKVKKLDTAPAMAIKGVAEVIEVGREFLYEGAAVAAVAAITPEIAEDAIHAIVVEYEELPHVVKAADAMKPGAARVYPEDPKVVENVRMAERRGDPEKVDAAIRAAGEAGGAVVEAEYSTPKIHHCCLETHGVAVDYRGGATATVYASTQGTFTIPPDAARTLKLPVSAVTAIVQHMGGGFGSKFGIGSEGSLACILSRKTGKPVKLMLTREDEFLMAGNRAGSLQRLRAAASKDGLLVAMHAIQNKLGGVGNGSQAGQPYQYKVAETYREVMSVHTNEDASRAMRAPGHPEASFAMESLMDELADKLGMDPVEFRLKNLGGGQGHVNATYDRQLRRGAKEIGWERRKLAGSGSGTLKRGFGCAIGAWGGGGGPNCVVTVTIGKDGAVTTSVGTQDLGTGTRTYVRAIVAEELGLGIDDVTEKIGNSKLGSANASGGSTTAASLSPAVKDAAFNARVMMAERVAPVLGAKADEVTFTEKGVSGNGKTLTWKQACAALPAAGLSAVGKWQPGLSGGGVHGACFAEVEVDTETGHVRPIKMVHVQDLGLPLNRLALESQINGGMIQALGMALYEGRVMDAQLGIMVNPGFGDYKIPGCLEMPELVPIIDDGDTRQQVVGVAEPACIPGVGAIANAVFNACRARVRDLPITPDKVLLALLAKT
jgi:xanthine dehydrogenase YagR molybdenum-binding subunit